jgi:hypothetical protein
MKNFIVKNWRWIVTTVIALAGILLPVLISINAFEKKSLGYAVSSISALVVEGKADLPLEIRYKGNSLESPFLSVIRLKNVGSVPISSSDFDKPITINTTNKAKIIAVKVGETSPATLPVKIDNNDTNISIQPLLLNPEDEVSLEIVTHITKPEFSISARVYGVKEVTNLDSDISRKRKLYPIVLAAVSALLYATAFSIVSVARWSVFDKKVNVLINRRATLYIMILLMLPLSFSIVLISNYFMWPWYGSTGLILLFLYLGEMASKLFVPKTSNITIKEGQPPSSAAS